MPGKERNRIEETREQSSGPPLTIGVVFEQINECGRHLAHFVEETEGGPLDASSVCDILCAVDHLVLPARQVSTLLVHEGASNASALLNRKEGGNEQGIRGLYG
jgi:hypothetical protein